MAIQTQLAVCRWAAAPVVISSTIGLEGILINRPMRITGVGHWLVRISSYEVVLGAFFWYPLVTAVPFLSNFLAEARHLPDGRHRAGDRHLNFYETRDNLLRSTKNFSPQARSGQR